MRPYFKGVLASAVWIPALLGCDAGTEKMPAVAPVLNTASLTQVAMPVAFRSAYSIDPEALQLRVIVNDVPTNLQRDETNWSGFVNVPLNQTSSVVVEWGTEYGTTGYLKLASQQKFVFVSADQNSVAFGENYNIAFDKDRDSRNNITEYDQNRSPVDNLDVTINVDGTYSTGGVAYPPSAECGQKIPIEIKTRSTDSDHEAWWCAKLKSELTDVDGNIQPIENLEITVNVKDDQLWTDSGTSAQATTHHDDSIEIFIDGDDSKRGAYDGVNDYQFRFAPLGEGVISKARGPSMPVNLDGKFTYYTGGYILVATIPLSQVGIRNNFPFGLNVEVNDDDDGGTRDAKYSWIGAEGEDIAWRNTTAFGTSQVPEIN